MKKETKPELRFAGFTDDGEQRKLGEIARNSYGGGTPRTNFEEYWKGDIPWIQSQDIIEDEVYGVTPRKFISKKEVAESATKYVPKNSIAIVTRVGVGKLAFMPFPYCTSQDFLSLGNLSSDGHFTTYAIYKMLQNEKNIVQGTSIKGITVEEMLAKQIRVPVSLSEQQRIGTFFHTLDSAITLHQRKCDALIKVKKSMLQKMFPKNGKSKPEVRFAGFTDDWEQRKLGEIYENITEKNDLTYGIDKNITVATMQFKDDIRVTDQDYLKTYNVFQIGDIAFEGHQSKEFRYGRFVENDIGNGIVSHIFAVFRPKIDYDLYYWKYAINNENLMKAILSRCTKASTMMNDLVTKDFLEEKYFVPSIAEQQRIGTFFRKLDSAITLHQREVEKLTKLKKALLSKMFI